MPYNALAQKDKPKTLPKEQTITQENAAKYKKLNELSAYATATLPLHDLHQKDIVEIIARSQAKLSALKRVAQNLKTHSVAFKGAHKSEQRLVLAAYLFNSSSKTSINTEEVNSNNREILTAMVSLSPDLVNFDAKLNKMLQMPDFFILCEGTLESITSLTQEAAHLISRASITTNNRYMGYRYVFWERITNLAYNIEGLWDFFKLLPHLEHTWKIPERIQKELNLLIKKIPNEAILWTALGEVQLQQDFPQESLDSFNKALLLSPKRARTLHARGLAHLRLQHSALAEKDISDALELYPNVTTWLRSRGAVYMLRKKYKLMCIDFQQACSLGDCEGLKLARRKNLCVKPK